jgi:transcriptional regulator with XRE-family HTH domain
MKLGRKTKDALKEPKTAARFRGKLTPGKALRIYREANELTQSELAKRSGMTQNSISALEHYRSTLGVDRAKILARVLKVHPAVLAFAGWDEEDSA